MKLVYRFSRSIWRKLPSRALFAATFAAVLGVVVGRAFIGSVSVVEGSSMVPSFQPGSYVFTVPISGQLKRGDVVVVDDGTSKYAMKRIVGMPGETVHLWRGHVFINRKMLSEPYLANHTYTFVMDQPDIVVLGANQYYVLGDNRPASVDSRTFGAVDRQHIKRRVPSPDNALHASFAPYTLPAPGKKLIQAL